MATALIALLIRAAVLVCVAWLASMMLRGRPASVRAFIWTAAFAGLIVLPGLTALLPTVPIVVISAEPPAPAAPVIVPEVSVPIDSDVRTQRQTVVVPVPVEAAAIQSRPVDVLGVQPTAARTPWAWDGIAVTFSLGITFLLIGRIVRAHLRTRAIVRACATLEPDSPWISLVNDTRASLRIGRTVRVRMGGAVSVPAVAGILQPTLLIPADADEWPLDIRRAVVVHELAHVARWDAIGQFVGSVACACYWFVPLVWFGARRASILRERASDDIVLRTGINPAAYAESLLTLVRNISGADLPAAALAIGRPSRMRERLVAILNPVERREALTVRKMFVLGVVTTSAVLFVAAAGVAAQSNAAQGQSGTAIHAPRATTAASSRATASTPAGEQSSTATSQRSSSTSSVQNPPAQVKGNGRLCDDGLRNSSSSVHEEDNALRRLTVKLEGTNCSVDLKAEGKFEFNASFTDVASIAPGGFFRLDVTEKGVRRQLEIESRNGTLTRIWRVDGKNQPYDDAAKKWFADFLIELDRRTGIGMEVRLPMLMRQGGANAVLDETALIPSDYVRNRYYIGLTKATKLSAGEMSRLMKQAASMTQSDYYATELVGAVAGQNLGDPAIRASVVEMIDQMKSDYYRSESIGKVTAAGTPTPAELDVLLKSIGRMSSDYYKQVTLNSLAKNGKLSADQQAAMARAATTMSSDYYAAEFLKTLAGTGTLSSAAARAYMEALGKMREGHYVDDVIANYVRTQPYSEAQARGAIEAAGHVASDHYRSEALKRVMTGWPVTDRDLLLVVANAKTIASDYNKSDVLTRVAAHKAATDQVRQAAVDAAAGMSSYYADQVRKTIRKN